jgi:Lrp/AsnC family transcriptional regulator, leucine-responsive regulatory protein
MEELTSLSLADKKIINLMEYSPRITFKELSRVCHLSKDTIKYRIKRLEREKIILGYTSFIDYKKIGNNSYKLYLKINSTLQEKNQLKDYLKKHKNIFSFFESTGKWNFAIAVFAKTSKEFNELENKILEKFGNIITDKRFCSMIDVEIYSKDFLEQKNKAIKVYPFWGDTENYKLDEIDKKLAKLLNKNSRISLVDLSEELNLSLDAIKNRINKLKENKIIPIYKTIINYELLGYDKYKLLLFPKTYSDKIEADLLLFFKLNKNCINAMRIIGPWKMEAEFLAKKPADMEKVVYELNEKFRENILDIEISIIRNEELFAGKDLLLD